MFQKSKNLKIYVPGQALHLASLGASGVRGLHEMAQRMGFDTAQRAVLQARIREANEASKRNASRNNRRKLDAVTASLLASTEI